MWEVPNDQRDILSSGNATLMCEEHVVVRSNDLVYHRLSNTCDGGLLEKLPEHNKQIKKDIHSY